MQLFDVYNKFNITLTKGEGVYVYDDGGRKYLDLYGGHGVISIGHAHADYIAAITEQLNEIAFYSNSVINPVQEKLADILTATSGYADYNLFLCNSGSEANENAIKLASFHTGKKKVIAFKNSFHGRTAASLNITDNPLISAPINNNNFPVEFIELNNSAQLESALKSNDVCALIVEGIQGVGGLDMPGSEFFKFIRQQCSKHQILLVLDEVQSGFGRSGKFFAHQHAGIKADIISMAKGMGNGFPVAGILINPEIKAKHGMLGSTFGGNHLACASSISVLEIFQKENMLPHVNELSKNIIEALKSNHKIKKIKGLGLMLGVELDHPVNEVRAQLLDQFKILTGNSANPNVLRILPPLNITWEQIQPFINALKIIL